MRVTLIRNKMNNNYSNFYTTHISDKTKKAVVEKAPTKVADHPNGNGVRETVIKRAKEIVELPKEKNGRYTCPPELILLHCSLCNESFEKPPRKKIVTCERCGTCLLLQCSKCRKIFRKYMTLYCHIKAICGNRELIETREGRVPCPDCGTKFASYENLRRHKKLTCKRQAAFKCRYCSFTSKYKASLELHERGKHREVTSEDLFKCEWCRKSFKHSQTLKRHRKYNCGKEKSFSCGHCDYKCYLKYQLKNHMRSRHEILFYGIRN